MALPAQIPKIIPRQLPRYSRRAVCIVLCLAVIGCVVGTETPPRHHRSLVSHHIVRREQDKECRLVHAAPDQCRFVRSHCPDEEAGLISYLDLYFCRLSHAKPLALIILLLWLGLLFSTIGIAASDFFSVNLSSIATLLGLSESVAGVTFLAFGNGSPDVFSTFAAMSTNSGSLAIGELIGAAGFISAVVAGSMALVRPFKVAKRSFLRDVIFFVVAASFSMVFLADGRLVFWECAVMVAFYVMYVIFVVFWHWSLGRKRRRKQKEAKARGHFLVVGNHEQPIVNDVDEEGSPISRADHQDEPADNFAALEGAGQIKPQNGDEEDQNEAREQWLIQINRNMRVQRPPPGPHRVSGNPIRPSLVGALEFRAVLSSLEKSRTQQAIPIGLRRYSDDPALTLGQQQQRGTRRSTFNPADNASLDRELATPVRGLQSGHEDGDLVVPHRNRAVSANDADALDRAGAFNFDTGVDHAADLSSNRLMNQPTLLVPGQTRSKAAPWAVDRSFNHGPQHSAPNAATNTRVVPDPVHDEGEQRHFPLGNDRHLQPEHPAFNLARQSSSNSLLLSPGTAGSSPAVPFPPYHDDPNFIPSTSRPHSIRLPPPSLDSGPFLTSESQFATRPLRWWPYRLLPTPTVLFSTLFPTLHSWKEKSFTERLLGIISAPTIFLLTITLPVVELGKGETNADISPVQTSHVGSATMQTNTPLLVNVSSEPDEVPRPLSQGQDAADICQARSTSRVADSAAHGLDHRQAMDWQSNPNVCSDAGTDAPSPRRGDWGRWLVSTQIFTAPLFVVVIMWANVDDRHSSRNLLLSILCTLVASLLVLAALLATTNDQALPKYRPVLCFIGFVVSVAWISTIAGEVVGVLKALGVILGISDAILGLTIFAVGNSLGDLVADITIAKLGFPVMALSACFGGPMLNILLGVGISGMYMTLKRKHVNGLDYPSYIAGEPSYHIEVSGTLIISGITLLVTLVGLLIAVPLNGWIMDRKIGWGLVILWCLSTIVNVVIEITGATRGLA